MKASVAVVFLESCWFKSYNTQANQMGTNVRPTDILIGEK